VIGSQNGSPSTQFRSDPASNMAAIGHSDFCLAEI